MSTDQGRQPSFDTGEGLRLLLQRINESDRAEWNRGAEARALFEHAIRKYARLCRKWQRDPSEAAAAAFVAMQTDYILNADDPWAIITIAVRAAVIAEAQSEKLLISPDRARQHDTSDWDAPVRAGEHEEFLFGLAEDPLDDHADSPMAAHIQRLVVELFGVLGWNTYVVASAIDYAITRVLITGDADRAHEYLRRDDTMPAALDLSQAQWRAFLRIIFDSRPAATGPVRRGLLRRIALLDAGADLIEQLAELLDDDDLVLAVLDAWEGR